MDIELKIYLLLINKCPNMLPCGDGLYMASVPSVGLVLIKAIADRLGGLNTETT